METSAAEIRTVDALVVTTGTVKGRNTAIMTSKVMGYVRDVRVAAGDEVNKGQTLAVLEADVISGTARRAKASLNASKHGVREAENGLRSAESGLVVAKATYERVKRLFASGSISNQQLDEARAAHDAAIAARDMARARVNAAGARVDEARAALSEARAMLSYAEVKAPFAGRVIERRVDPGNLASPGTPLLVVEQVGALRIEAPVDESKAGRIHIGDAVQVTIPAAYRVFSGKVEHVVPAVDTASRSLIVKVQLDDPNARDVLRPGMFARTTFSVGTTKRLVVPTTSVVPHGQLVRVFVVEDSIARLRVVSLGEQRDGWTEVLSGLDQGEMVVVSPPATLSDETRTAL